MQIKPNKAKLFRHQLLILMLGFFTFACSDSRTSQEAETNSTLRVGEWGLKSAEEHLKLAQDIENFSNRVCSLPLFGYSFERAETAWRKANLTPDIQDALAEDFQIADHPSVKTAFKTAILGLAIDTRQLRAQGAQITLSSQTHLIDQTMQQVHHAWANIPGKGKIGSKVSEPFKPILSQFFKKIATNSGVSATTAQNQWRFFAIARNIFKDMSAKSLELIRSTGMPLPKVTGETLTKVGGVFGKILKIGGWVLFAYQGACTAINLTAASTRLFAIDLNNKMQKERADAFLADKCGLFNSKLISIDYSKFDWCNNNFANVERLFDFSKRDDLAGGVEVALKSNRCYDQNAGGSGVGGVKVKPINNLLGVPNFQSPEVQSHDTRLHSYMALTALRYTNDHILMAKLSRKTDDGAVISGWTYAGSLDVEKCQPSNGQIRITQ